MFFWIGCSIFLSVGQAWGPTGHRAVGLIAERHISPRTRTALAALMGTESLARASTWSDEIRSDPAWAKREPNAPMWHYINATPDQDTLIRPDSPDNIWSAIERFQAVLADDAQSVEDRRIAVRWLTHLVGDAHQPLHTGYAEDRGGNRVDVMFFDTRSNLHRVWDEDLIEHSQLSYTELVDFIDHATPEQETAWRSASVGTWLQESRDLLAGTYEFDSSFLSYGYVWQHTPIVQRRILQAGHRLAEVLDAALDPRRKRRRR